MCIIGRMRKPVLIIILTLACLLFTACQPDRQQQRRPGASIEGIKIGDLKPADSPKKPSQVRLTVFTYEMPTENASIVTDIYKTLPEIYIKFSSLKTYKTNGFNAGFGQNNIWKHVGDSLGMAMARSARTDNLIFLDSSTNEIVAGRAFQGQTFYLHKRSGQTEMVTLKDGQFLWRVKARALPERKGVALVQIQMLHKELAAIMKRLPGQKTGETIYHDMDIKLNMSPGDFVVIGPASEENPQVKLGDLYFQRRGDLVIPKTRDRSDKDSQGQPLYKIEKNIPLTRVYVFACMGVES